MFLDQQKAVSKIGPALSAVGLRYWMMSGASTLMK